MLFEVPDSGGDRRGGLFDSLKTLAATLVAIAHTRLDLLSTELEEERVWLGSMLAWTLVALFCAGLGVVLATVFVVVAYWETHRLLALGVLAAVFLLAAVLAVLAVLAKARAKPRLFAGSLAELSSDREQLRQ
ncbi:MAG: phage holin family protein [Gammaproteobacteria bacterium]|nr:phage holin family protein [Gammaproteobacteria bacterium]